MHWPYDLNNPTRTYKLPNKYKEISGITPCADSNCLAFVQDEAIQLFTFDLEDQNITEYEKHQSGDAEDLVIAGSNAYLLQAGKQPSLYKITNFASSHAPIERYDLNLSTKHDPEGLCLDTKHHRLLIACKGSPIEDDTDRAIFAFDLQSATRLDSPVLTIDCQKFLGESPDRFHPSGIAIHPQTNDIYIIGSKGIKIIVCYGMDGQWKGAWELDKHHFLQPEGITFLNSGELVICSEGKKGKKARIMTFARDDQSQEKLSDGSPIKIKGSNDNGIHQTKPSD